jgi:hypothetical protein
VPVADRTGRTLPRRLLLAALAVALLAALAVRTAWSLDRARAGAPFAPGDPGVIVRELRPPGQPGAAPASRTGTLAYRAGTWHTLIDLHGLPDPGPGRRTMVFARYAGGWVVLGGTRPGPDGSARLNYRADPPPWDLFEVMVTEGTDTGEANPHGRLLLLWSRPDLARFNREPWPVEWVR